MSATPPNKDKISNWLPAPRDDFSLFICAYWSDETVLKSQGFPRAVQRMK